MVPEENPTKHSCQTVALHQSFCKCKQMNIQSAYIVSEWTHTSTSARRQAHTHTQVRLSTF